MKQIIIFTLLGYKKIISPILDEVFGSGRGCRFNQTCSTYAAKAIEKHGVIKGGYLSIVRLLHCQPFSSHNIKYESI